MNKQQKVDFVINTLKELYPEIPIPLDHKDPYTLLIAVLLSAQSTDVRVNKITPLLFKEADNPYDMIKLSIDQIREIIRPVGLSPAKAQGASCRRSQNCECCNIPGLWSSSIPGRYPYS
jgi:endonuclease-3